MATHLAPVSELRGLLAGVARISAAVNTAEPLGNVLNTVAETTSDLLEYDFTAVLLPDPEKQRLLIKGSHGLSPSYVATVNTEKPIRLGSGAFGEGPSSRAFRNLEPVVIRDYHSDPAAVPWAGVAIEQGLRSLASVPLVVSGEAIGTLNCYTRALHDFSPEELLLLVTMANLAASAIEAARLREQQRDTISHLEEARGSLEAQTLILQRSEDIHTELTAVVLADAGLGSIAVTLSKILAGSVLIEDPFGVVLATSDEGASLGLDGVTPVRPEVSRVLDHLLTDRQPRSVSAADHPAFEDGAFVAPVTIGREVVARLWVLHPTGLLDAVGRRALEHGATVIALELLKQRIASEVEARLRGELLDDLLEGRLSDHRALEARARQLQFGLGGRHAAMVVIRDGEHEATADDAELRRRLLGVIGLSVRRRQARALVGERDGLIVVLVGESGDAPAGPTELADAIRAEVRRSLGPHTASIAIGPWIEDIDGVARSYRIARGAIELGRRAGPGDRTIVLDDLGVYGLLLTVGRLDELVAFAETTIGPIREYDERRGAELLPTLRAYLAAGCRTADAATAMVVHPNTVAYRIRRTEAILDLDLSQPDSLLQVQLALIVDELAAADTATDPRARRMPARPSRPRQGARDRETGTIRDSRPGTSPPPGDLSVPT